MAKNARKVATELAQIGCYGKGELVEGVGDAFRHCYWTATTSRPIGIEKTLLIAESHEKFGSFDPTGPASRMDLHNNAVGASIGPTATSDDDAKLKCLEAARTGRLIISPSLVPSM